MIQHLLELLDEQATLVRRDLCVTRDRHLGHRLLELALEPAELVLVAARDERDRATFTASARRAADAVDVGLGVVWHVVVDDVRDVVDVDAASSDVCRDDDVDLAIRQALDDCLAGGLAQVAVDRVGGEAARVEVAGELGGPCASAREDEGRVELLGHQDLAERVGLLIRRDLDPALIDVRRGQSFGLDVHADRIVEVGLRDAADVIGHRRREERDLARGWRDAEDVLDVFDEAHLEHLVCFVEDQHLELGEVERAALDVVEHAPRCPDDDRRAGLEPAELLAVPDPSVDGQDLERQELGERVERGRDLLGELARRREHEAAGLATTFTHHVDEREAERSCLA